MATGEWDPPEIWTLENVIAHLKDHAHQCRCIPAAIHMLEEHVARRDPDP